MPKPRPDWSASEYRWTQFHISQKKLWQIGHNWCCINILGRVFSYRVKAAHVTRELQDGDVILGMQVCLYLKMLIYPRIAIMVYCLWFFSRCSCLNFKLLIFSIHPRILFYHSFQVPSKKLYFSRFFTFQDTPLAPLPFTAVQGIPTLLSVRNWFWWYIPWKLGWHWLNGYQTDIDNVLLWYELLYWVQNKKSSNHTCFRSWLFTGDVLYKGGLIDWYCQLTIFQPSQVLFSIKLNVSTISVIGFHPRLSTITRHPWLGYQTCSKFVLK